MTTPQDKAAEALRLAETTEWRIRDLTFKEYDTVAAMLREYAALLQARAAEAGRVPSGWKLVPPSTTP